MEKMVENWLNENSSWFEAYAMENLNLKLVEKWLKMNDKKICKCHENRSLKPLSFESINQISLNNSHDTNDSSIKIKLDSEPTNNEEEILSKLHHSHSYTCVIHNRRISNNNRNYHRSDAYKMLSSTEELSSEDESKENASNKQITMSTHFNQFPPLFTPNVNNNYNNNNNNNSFVRRSNFFSMRKHHSLSTSNSISNLNLLKYLIETKIKLPSHLNQHFFPDKLKLTSERVGDTDFLLEMIKDISYELDLNTLSEKILGNIKFLLNADKASLFFVCHTRKCLASFKYDAYSGCTADHLNSKINEDLAAQYFEMEVPFGQTILGHVAQTGNLINIKNFKQVHQYFMIKENSSNTLTNFIHLNSDIFFELDYLLNV